MGCGKSTVGRRVAELAAAPYFDLDQMLEESSGLAVGTYFARHGEPAFRALEAQLLPQLLQPGSVTSLGGGTPVPEANWRLLQERARTVYLAAPLELLLARAGRQATRPLLVGRSRQDLEQLWRARLPRYEAADGRVDAARPIEEVAQEVLALWDL
ncbi:MAG: shikimate kinase [Candidatus Dormibacteraeota bacterium]|nr:shikimate kinase [Candidatus Dormibacteraeota bacterium]